MIILHNPVHPGDILKEEFMAELDLPVGELANAVQVLPAQIEDIVRREVVITADMAVHLSKYLGTSPDFWLNLQRNYDRGIATN